jgi:putative endonuclease
VLRRLARLLGLMPARWRPADATARRGEDLAAAHLRGLGYSILGRNVRLAFAEADIVAEDHDADAIVLVEVKCRRIGGVRGLPPPEAAVTAAKRRKLVAAARALARLNRWQGRRLRIDVVAIDLPERGEPVLRHHVNAVRA